MSFKGSQRLSCLHIPQTDGMIERARGKYPPIWRPGDTVDYTLVTPECMAQCKARWNGIFYAFIWHLELLPLCITDRHPLITTPGSDKPLPLLWTAAQGSQRTDAAKSRVHSSDTP